MLYKGMVRFMPSAFRHGYDEADFFEVLESGPLKVRSRRGMERVYELYGQNFSGDYLHVAYRREDYEIVVFHMRQMTFREKQLFRKWLR